MGGVSTRVGTGHLMGHDAETHTYLEKIDLTL